MYKEVEMYWNWSRENVKNTKIARLNLDVCEIQFSAFQIINRRHCMVVDGARYFCRTEKQRPLF